MIMIIVDVMLDSVRSIMWYVKSSMYVISRLVNAFIPFACLLVGRKTEANLFLFAIGIAFLMLSMFIVKEAANKAGKGNLPPVPRDRFTSVSEEGEVTVNIDRMQELLLYVADLEDYFERKGMM